MEEVAPGEVEEIVASGENIASGYCVLPKNRQSVSAGVPASLREQLLECEGMLEAAVVGVPDEVLWGSGEGFCGPARAYLQRLVPMA